MIDVYFYKYDGHTNTVIKTLPNAVTMTGLLRDVYNTFTPTLKVRTETVFGFNYCYIPAFGKYYFIDAITVESANTYTLALSEDVLMTYKDLILASTGTVTESDTPNKYSSNRSTVYNVKPIFQMLNFPNTGLFNSEGSIIMITIKGNK